MLQNGSQEPITLTPEELAAIDAVPSYEPGQGVTVEEALERARKHTRAWLQAMEPTTESS